MTTLDRLERETETTRTRVAELLDELRGRVSPGELVDQIVESIGDGAAGDFVRTLGAQIRDNPLPCLMIGAGVAWLVTADYRVHGAADGSSNATESAMDQVDHTMYRAREMAADAGERVADAAGSATAAVSSGLHGAARSARDAGRSAAGAGRRASGSFAQLLREQPLVTAGLGLALGALLGAALPSTETESRMVGETSDAVKARARDAVGEGIEKAKAVAERTYEAAKHEAAAAAEHVKDEAVHAAGEQGFATGTLRAEHERVEAEHPDAT
jgi:ElaB/YqjD/DUF883 family membrane-anchored ribosome-binding protein